MTDLEDHWNNPAVPIILRSTTTSPYGRKVRMAADILGLTDRFERQDADTLDAADTLRQQNPLGKMPCLLIGGEAFFDSSVIVEMLDALAGGGKLIVPAGLARFRQLTRARLADGIIDAAVLVVYEGRFRAAESASDRWLEHQRGKIRRALAAFEAAPPAPRADIVSIGLGAALGYLDWRQPVAWRDDNPGLVRWLDAFAAATPAYHRTERTVS